MRKPDRIPTRVDALARLFPECVTEARNETTGEIAWAIDFDQLRQELADHVVDGPRERYRLEWPGKRAAALAANAPTPHALRPCRHASVDFDTTGNLFIEGDNLDALKLLQARFASRIQVIFIDPPYNSGKLWTYQDRFKVSAAAYAQQLAPDAAPSDDKQGRFPRCMA